MKITPPNPVFIFHGLPGSGKSFVTAILAKKLNAVVLSVDAFYISLGYDIVDALNKNSSECAYQAAVTAALAHLKTQPVILDCTSRLASIRASARTQFLAAGHSVIFIICIADLTVARERVNSRVVTAPNHLMSGIGHFNNIVKTFEPLSETELSSSLQLDTNGPYPRFLNFQAQNATDRQTILSVIQILEQ